MRLPASPSRQIEHEADTIQAGEIKHLLLSTSYLVCWKRGTYAHTYEHTYAHTYTPAVSYFRSGRSGLALGVFIRPPTSSFIKYALPTR